MVEMWSWDFVMVQIKYTKIKQTMIALFLPK